MKKENKLKLGIPGRTFKEPIEKLFKSAGYDIEINENLSIAEIDDPEIECFFARAKEITPLIEKGILDGGITSRAVVAESRAKVIQIYDLGTLTPTVEETKVVLAVPEKSQIKSIRDLKGKKIITRVPGITKEFFEKHKIFATIWFSNEASESKVPDFADAVVEFSNTGVTLKQFNLRILDVLMRDSMLVVANENSLKNNWKKRKIENLGLLLKGARLAQEYAGLMLHASNDMMEEVLKILPALKKPTVTHLRGENWFDVFTVAKKKEVRVLIPKLKKIGCTDIVELPLNKVVI